MLIFDAHLDLAMNAMQWNRDLTCAAVEIRQRETGRTDLPDRGQGTVSLPDMRRGQVGLCVATMIARYVMPGSPLPGCSSPEIAWAQTQGQLAWYRAMEERGQMVQITDAEQLQRCAAQWHAATDEHAPIGYVLSLEGADSILSPRHLELAYAQGLRALGPAHYGPGTYAHGTHSDGGLGVAGRELLGEMERLGVILDATHLCDASFREALDVFGGRIWASHSNCRSLVDHDRQFTDEQLRRLIERDAVIGAAFDAWMLVPQWKRGQSDPVETGVCLSNVVDQIDHVCQLAGNARHAAVGSDLDGGFGREQCPTDLDTIADLQKLDPLLRERGYGDDDVQLMLHGNWIRFLEASWG